MVTTSGIDNEHVRSLARSEIRSGCSNAPEIGQRIARAIGREFQAGEPNSWENLLGLAALGAAYYGRSALKENRLTVHRRGSVATISGGYALPSTVVTNGHASEPNADVSTARAEYVQFDLLTWAELSIVLSELRDRRGALDATIVTFEEIAKLETTYPALRVGEAISRAGLDLHSRNIDLDSLGLIAS